MQAKILIVDDELYVKNLIAGGALADRNYEFFYASDGLEGIQIAREVKPDLIISDIVMPRMNGWEFCINIKKIPDLQGIPFVFLSATGSDKDRVKGLKLGADDFLVKPFYPDELELKVSALINRKEQEKLSQGAWEMTGNLEHIQIGDLLQMLQNQRNTGILKIRSGKRLASVIFYSGLISGAEFSNFKDLDALYPLLEWQTGNFYFN